MDPRNKSEDDFECHNKIIRRKNIEMKQRPLGRTGLSVSEICLGTMTWGEQNTEAEGHEQMDYALERGVNFFDAAELYPIPPKPETQGRTEEIIGTWFKARGNRDKVILATKVIGRSDMTWFRDDGSKGRPNRKQIMEAVEKSLKRLQTDYIDLYQLHWPGRPVSEFGANPVIYRHNEGDEVPVEEIFEAFSELVKSGKVRHIGLSNESAWGVMKWLELSSTTGGPRIASVQNVYNLASRTYETALAEISMREDVGLLAYSPLAQGYLTGKYRGGALPEGSRKQLFQRLGRYETPGANYAFEAYFKLCEKRNIDPTQLAIKFTLSKPFVASSIIGATSMEQLKTNIDAADLLWDKELDQVVNMIHSVHTNPCP
jgi:aryl-alcohol dehydrogenase-like predicted oxidoreductase